MKTINCVIFLIITMANAMADADTTDAKVPVDLKELEKCLISFDTEVVRQLTVEVLREVKHSLYEASLASERAEKQRLDAYLVRAMRWQAKEQEEFDLARTRFVRAYEAAKHDERQRDMRRLADDWLRQKKDRERRLRENQSNMEQVKKRLVELDAILKRSINHDVGSFRSGPPVPPPHRADKPDRSTEKHEEPLEHEPALNLEQAEKLFEKENKIVEGQDFKKGGD